MQTASIVMVVPTPSRAQAAIAQGTDSNKRIRASTHDKTVHNAIGMQISPSVPATCSPIQSLMFWIKRRFKPRCKAITEVQSDHRGAKQGVENTEARGFG